MTTTTTSPATSKQIAFIERLLSEKNTTGTAYEGWTPDWTRATRQAASAVIEYLLGLPTATSAMATPGYYVTDDGAVYVVVENKAGTATYAKRMEVTEGRGSWTYAPGAARDLAGAQPLTVEEAAKLGRQHGACMVCGRTLTDPESVERGIGPVCATRL